MSNSQTLHTMMSVTTNVKNSTEIPAHSLRNPMAAQNWLNPSQMCTSSISLVPKYQTVIVVRQTNRRWRTDSNALTKITMNRISTVNDKHTPALTPLAVANPRNWSLLRLVQFTVAGIELPSILVAWSRKQKWKCLSLVPRPQSRAVEVIVDWISFNDRTLASVCYAVIYMVRVGLGLRLVSCPD